MELDQENLRQIYRLNQRGGRPLSVLDLVAANTVDIEVAAFLAGAVSAGASILTAARPGNAGKTTLLAALLPFLPPGRRIITVEDPSRLPSVSGGACLLAHEIGDGAYYSYLWGAAARGFFEAPGPGLSAASCIHADTLDELRSILCGPPIGLSPERFSGIQVVAFLKLERAPAGYRRRVAGVYAGNPAGDGSHRRLFRWDERADTFVREAPSGGWARGEERARGLLRKLSAEGITEFEGVYRQAREAAGG